MFIAQPDSSFKLDQYFLKNNSDFTHGCADWYDDLVAGKNDPIWQRDAVVASQQRAAGEFDQFKEKEMEEYWGQKHAF